MFSKNDYVYEIYKEKSFTKAAQKLYISQPSISAAIKNLESEIGSPIFERSGAEIKLTPIGVEYISAVEKILEIENEFKRKLQDTYDMEIGEISIGTTGFLSTYILPGIINRYTNLYPKISISLSDANSSHLSELIQSDKVDIGLDCLDDEMDFYDKYPLRKETIMLCVPANLEINKKLSKYQINPDDIYTRRADIKSVPSVPIDAFKNENFILLKKGHSMYNHASKIFAENGIEPKIVYSVDQFSVSYLLSESGMGVCFVSDTLFKYSKFHKNVLAYNIDDGINSRSLCIVHKKNKYKTKAMEKFIELSKELIKD